jgi:hypothetical protein
MISTDLVSKAILHELERHTAEITKEEGEKAAAEVRRRVAALTGQIAAKVSQLISYESRGTEVIVSVRFP